MSIKKDSLLRDITGNLSEDDGSITFILEDFSGQSFDSEALNPTFDVIGSFFKKPIGCPLFVIFPGLVGDFDELGERGNDPIPFFIKNGVHKLNALVPIEFTLHIFG